MTTTTLYGELTERLAIAPEKDEDEQTFLTRLFRTANALEEDKWDELSEAAQHWCNDASDAVGAKKPIQALPGAPFTNGADQGEEEPAPPRRAASKTSTAAAKKTEAKADAKKTAEKPAAKAATTKKTAAAATGKADAKPAAKEAAKPAAAAKKAAPKKTAAVPKADRPKGVLDLLMEATYHNPSETPAQLQARVKAANPDMEVKLANAVGIRQQYRRIVRFLQSKGHVKDLKTE